MEYLVPNEFIIETNKMSFDDYAEKYQIKSFDQEAFDEAGGFEGGAKYNYFVRHKYDTQQLRNMYHSRNSGPRIYTRYLEEQAGVMDVEVPDKFIGDMFRMQWKEYRDKYNDENINRRQLSYMYRTRVTNKKMLYIRYLQSLID